MTDHRTDPTPHAGPARPVTRRTALLGGAAAAAALVAGATPAAAGGRGTRLPERIELPDGFQPEGIATAGPTAYLGSRATGDLVRVDLRRGTVSRFSTGPGTPSLGLKVTPQGRLVVAGGTGGDARIVDARSGRVLASYRLQEGTAFINDVVLTPHAAYLTDSANPQLFAIPLRGRGLPAAADVRRIPLSGQWQQLDGNNGNGITTTPDGRALLVVNSTAAVLYRVDARTGAATAVDLGGVAVANGDGLLREGRTLLVVQNRLNRIAVFALAADGRSGRLVRTITSADFDVPTTVARWGDGWYLPNARFTTPATPTTPYWITRVPAGRR